MDVTDNKQDQTPSVQGLPVVMFNGSECWAINKAEIQRITAVDRWCLRRILDIRWQARRHEMKMGVFSVKKWKMGVSCENVDLSLTQVALRIVQYFLFDILLIWGCVLAQRTPLPTGPGWHDCQKCLHPSHC